VSSSSLTGKAGIVSFAPRARLMKLIGGELVSDEVVAITELVKNAYDADARTVRLEFNNVVSGEGEIVISDDGHGMSLQDVADYWMQPGGTSKTGNRKSKSSRGRRVLGEKGIGRFAADKLGAGLELTTRKKGQKKEVLVEFDWNDFEHETRMLSDVNCEWRVRTATEIHKQGTILRITNLHEQWNERLFRKLCVRLGRLKTPFRDTDKFKIVIDSDDFPDYAGELTVDYLDMAPHHLEAQFDGDQEVVIAGKNEAPETLIWNGDGNLDCGPVRVRLYGFDLETLSIAKVGPPRAVRGWLREWTGVSIFRDDFRISPYGEPSDDWLRLDQRRVNNPVVRLSNNQIIGFVEIEREANANLIDQTNREGMISNKAFEDLRRLVLFVMQQLESRRQEVRHPAIRGPVGDHDSTAVQKSLADDLDDLAEAAKPVGPAKLRALAKRVRENAERERRRARSLADGYAELAAVGQVAEETNRRVAFVADDIESTIEELASGSTKAKRALKNQMIQLRQELALLAGVQNARSKRRRTIDLHQEIERAVEGYQSRFDARTVRLQLPSRKEG
jgi:hypothetical protein